MTRDFDRKEAEREKYLQDHSSTRFLTSKVAELEAENAKLKEQIADLKSTIRELKDKK